MTYNQESRKAKSEYDRDRYQKIRADKLTKKLPDPITNLSNEDIAYIAGLIDGEGSIYIASVGPNRRKTVYPIVVVAMTNMAVIQWLTKVTKTGTIKVHNSTSLKRYPYMKIQYRWQLFGKRAQLLCSRILPYLKVKNQQARLILDFPCDMRIGRGRKLIDTDVNETRLSLREQVNGLNHIQNRPRINIDKREFFGTDKGKTFKASPIIE